MTGHNYNQSLKYEKDQIKKADLFYENNLGVYNIERCVGDDLETLALQRQDVDLFIENTKGRFAISEKFRKEYYGDVLIEIYSKYPDTEGWIYKNGAHSLAYFTPKSILIIRKREISDWICKMNIKTEIIPQIQQLLENSLKKSSMVKIEIQGAQVPLIIAHNEIGQAKWDTVSIGLNKSILEKIGVRYKEYPA